MHELLIGMGGGLLIGSTGSGAGSLITPLLILSGHSATSSVAAGIAAMFVSKLSGSLVHGRLGHWPGPAAWFVIAGGVAGALVVFAIPGTVRIADGALRIVVGVTLLAGAAVATLASRRDVPAGVPVPCRALLFATGLAVAPLVALTSAGSGSILVPLLLLLTAWPASELAAMSNWFGLIAGGAGSLIHLHLHALDVPLLAMLLIGGIPGVIGGALLSRVISRQSLTYATYIVTLFLATALLA